MLVTLGMTALTYGIVTTDRLGWGSAGALIPLAAGAALLLGFALYEGNFAREPLMPLRIFRMRTLRAANLTIFLLYAAIFGFWFFQSLYMQGTLGFSALETGLAFVPMTVAVGAGATLAPRLTKRVGARAVLVAGMLSAAAGEALLTGVTPGGSYLATVLPGGILGAFGLGLSLVPATIVAVQGVPARVSGMASGVLNTSRFVGAALGLAVLSTLATSHTHSEIASGTATSRALTDGFSVQFELGVLFCLAGAAAAAVMLRSREEAGEVPQPERA
jgi:predicted MFS family arabinose efflux permease